MCVGNRFLVITFNRLPVYYSWTVVTIIVGIDNANGTSASLTGQMLSEKQIQASINRHGRSSLGSCTVVFSCLLKFTTS